MIRPEVIDKLTSGRYFQTVSLTTTYCLGIIGFLVLAVMKMISIEVLLALWAGFTPMVILINEWYFKRDDRKTENGGKNV